MIMKVILYGTETCIWCHKARDFLKENKIKYKNINVGRNAKAAEEMIKKSNQRSVPVIEIDGKIFTGYEEDELRKVLKIKR